LGPEIRRACTLKILGSFWVGESKSERM
jgi:hypothetical protein